MTPQMAKRATPHTKCFTQTACRMSQNYKTAEEGFEGIPINIEFLGCARCGEVT